MSHRYFVYIVEDDEGVRRSLSRHMAAEGYEVSCFTSGREFLDSPRDAHHACVVLDIRLPDMSGLEVQAELVRRGVHFPIVIITGYGDIPLAVRAMKFGAIDFLQKPFEIEVLMERVREAFARHDQTREQQIKRMDATARLARISGREREVLDLVVAGMSSKNIAEKLGLMVKTVENHRAHIKKKLGVESVAELVQLVLMEKATGSSEIGAVMSLNLVQSAAS